MYELIERKTIVLENGFVRHGLRVDEDGFPGFGEVYFSEVKQGCVKGWKRHSVMTLNLLPVVGRFFLYLKKEFGDESITVDFGEEDYKLVRIEPNVWFAFEGLDEKNILANVASIPHDPDEAEVKLYEDFE